MTSLNTVSDIQCIFYLIAIIILYFIATLAAKLDLLERKVSSLEMKHTELRHKVQKCGPCKDPGYTT